MFNWQKLSNLLWFLIVVSLLLLLIDLKISPVEAQSDTAVRSEVYSLRNRVDRLESEVRRLSQSNNRSNPSPNPSSGGTSAQIIDGELVGRSDPLFERLATLVIELKERITNLEKRMTALEEKLKT
jgi:BMFP domain-containing protein YqiC